jgi:HSP20 family protein
MLPVKSNLRPTVSRFFEDDWDTIFDWNIRNLNNVKSTLPSVNVEENDDAFIIELAAPGFEKENFKIELKNDLLVVEGESNLSEVNENSKVVKREFTYSNFKRSFKIDNTLIDSDKIEAAYNAGILRILLNKKEQAKPKPPLQIDIT